MRRFAERSSRAERLAYVALSGAWTAGAVLLLLVGRPGRLLERLTTPRESRPSSERVTYLVTGPEVPAESPDVAPPLTYRAPSRSTNIAPRADTASASPAPRAPTVVPSTLPPIPLTIESGDSARAASTSRDTRSSAGAPASATTSGFARPTEALAPDSSKDVVRSAMSAGARMRPALEQAVRDEQMRAQSREAMAARAAGTPNFRPMVPGGGIPVPLPFGGPSRKQRERDRAVHAQNLEALTRLQRRADSLAALRKRTADSLRVRRDSLPGIS